VQLPTIELTKVYRQAGDSTILENAHRILRGEKTLVEAPDFRIIRGGATQFSQQKLAQSLVQTIPAWEKAGAYDPETDIFLSPFNVQDLGTDNLNKIISQYIGDKRGAVVHEIIACISKLYLAIGDKVFVNRRVGYITAIARNMDYIGKPPRTASKNLLRFGTYRAAIEETEQDLEEGLLQGYENFSLESLLEEEKMEKKKQASHTVTVEMETGEELHLSAVGDFSPQDFSLGYALTVHKAQGCEWKRVFFVLHKDHSVMAHRELFYTAVTRAREEFIAIAKDFMLEKAIATQRIKGNSLAEKIAFFNSGVQLTNDFCCYKD
jgi:exodeoxyribonuclease V alpha subunit